MKKAILLSLLLILLLSGCKQHTEVPDVYIQWQAEDYLTSENILDSEYSSYEIKASHFPNPSANIDTVNVVLIVNAPYGVFSVESQQVFQYSRSDDTWSIIRDYSWYNETSTFNEASLCKTWYGGDDYQEDELGNTYEIYIDDIDFSSKTVSCTYSFFTNILDDYHVNTVYYSDSGTFDFSNGLIIAEEKVTYKIYFSIWDGVRVYADSGIFRND